MSQVQTAADCWEGIYYPNPIPLSSRTLLASALLFDKLHIPGLSIPQVRINERTKPELCRELFRTEDEHAKRKLGRWAMEQPALADFVFLPDGGQDWIGNVKLLEPMALQLLDDTYRPGISTQVEQVAAAEIFCLPGCDEPIMSLTWPLYQARALAYASECGLPLISDDPFGIPPLPVHPDSAHNTKSLAQHLAVEAISLSLPTFRSVTPQFINEFRSATRELARPFRVEMVRLTTELQSAIVGGLSDVELKKLCENVAHSRVIPALEDLKRQLAEPGMPWHSIALEATAVALAAASSTDVLRLTAAWAILRTAQLATQYAKSCHDKQGKRKSGLSYLLQARQSIDRVDPQSLSEWDQIDWRCSGFVYVPEPGVPLTPLNRAFMESQGVKGVLEARTMRCIEQTTSSSVMWASHKSPS